MEVKIYVNNTKPVQLTITGIGMLSKEEYLKYKQEIVGAYDSNWRLQITDTTKFQQDLNDDKSLYFIGNVYDTIFHFAGDKAVRPVLKVKSSDLKIGDWFTMFGHEWRSISEQYILCCDHIVFYDQESIEKLLEDWLEKEFDMYDRLIKRGEKYAQMAMFKELIMNMFDMKPSVAHRCIDLLNIIKEITE